MLKEQNTFRTEHVPPLVRGEVHLWTLSLAASRTQIDSIQTILSPEELKRASYFKFENLQHNYMVSKAFLRLLLSSYLGIKPEEILVGIHKKGKPFLLNDVSLHFNLSDSHGICAYAFSRDGEVGIDIEKIRDLPDIDQLIQKNLTSSEKRYLQKDPGNKLKRFFQFWTFKESYLKAIGEGLRITPENLEFSIEDGCIRLQSNNYGYDSSNWLFKGFEPAGNFTGTLTYTGNNTVIREMSMDLDKIL